MNNKDLQVPSWVAIVPSDTVDIKSGLRGFEVWAACNVTWVDATNFLQTQTFTAPFPVRVTGQIKRINATDTTAGIEAQSGLTRGLVGIR